MSGKSNALSYSANNITSFFKDNILLIIKGMIVGTGAILPGVSGGVLCMAFGIYEPMMAILAHPNKSLKKYYKMFIPFLIGWILGFILLAKVVELLFEYASAIAMMLFVGLILGTIPKLMKESNPNNTSNWNLMILSLGIFILIFGLLKNGELTQITPNTWWYLFCGLIWGLSLIIPGLSSSSLLILIGLYQPMTSGIASLNFKVIIPLLLGLIITALTLSKLVNSLFNKKRELMLKAIIGIMIASTIYIIPTSFNSILELFISCITFMIGFAIALWMDKETDK